MARLERLDLTSRKLISLRGVESLQSLQWLDLYACTKLDALDPIGLCPKIRHLAITSTKRFKDISPIGSLESLRVLHLDDDGEFESLKPLLRCTLLEELSFFGTTRITDGKISVLEQFKHLRTLRFTPRRAYDRTRKEILAETPG